MIAARRSVPALASFALAWSSLARAEAPAEVSPAAAPTATPSTAESPAPPRLRTIHRQVSRQPLAYRSLPVGDRASVAARERIAAALARVPDKALAFNDAPLRDVVEKLRTILAVPVTVDTRALEDLGLDLDTPVTFTHQGTSSRAALHQMLRPLELAWIVRDETLLITTGEQAEENLEVRLYPLPWGYHTEGEVQVQQLIDLIQSTVAADTWDTVGGPGTIRPLESSGMPQLIVSHSTEVHDEVEGLVRRLHEQALAEFGGPDDPAGKVPTVRVHHVADEQVREDLAGKLVELCNTSLPQGADSDARVTPVGDCLVVQSRSPEFHGLAGQLIRAVAGEQVVDDRVASGLPPIR
jgi:hypothetical protein